MILYLYNLRYVSHVITKYIPLPNKCDKINHHFQKIHRRKNRVVVVVKIFRGQEKTIMINDDIQENRKKCVKQTKKAKINTIPYYC